LHDGELLFARQTDRFVLGDHPARCVPSARSTSVAVASNSRLARCAQRLDRDTRAETVQQGDEARGDERMVGVVAGRDRAGPAKGGAVLEHRAAVAYVQLPRQRDEFGDPGAPPCAANSASMSRAWGCRETP